MDNVITLTTKNGVITGISMNNIVTGSRIIGHFGEIGI